MAVHKITAGGSIDTLNKRELDAVLTKVLTSWRQEVGRGIGSRRFSRQGTVDATGALTIGGTDQNTEGNGPDTNMVWSVNRLAVANAGPSPVLNLYLNSPDPSAIVRPNLPVYANFGTSELILEPGDALLVTGSALTPGAVVTMTGQTWEVPRPLLWKLLG